FSLFSTKRIAPIQAELHQPANPVRRHIIGIALQIGFHGLAQSTDSVKQPPHCSCHSCLPLRTKPVNYPNRAFEASMASSKVRKPVCGALTRTAMLPGRCSFFHM